MAELFNESLAARLKARRIAQGLTQEKLALQSGVSAQTAYKHASEPERVHAIDLAVLTRFLVNGAKLTEEQVLNLRLGDILEFAG